MTIWLKFFVNKLEQMCAISLVIKFVMAKELHLLCSCYVHHFGYKICNGKRIAFIFFWLHVIIITVLVEEMNGLMVVRVVRG